MYWNHDPQEEFELLELIGGGAYATVYKGKKNTKRMDKQQQLKQFQWFMRLRICIGNKDFESKITLISIVNILTLCHFWDHIIKIVIFGQQWNIVQLVLYQNLWKLWSED